MNIDDFQTQALKSIAINQRGTVALAHRALGLSGEAGILANLLKKVIRDQHSELSPDDIETIKKRLGDILYYTAALADYCDLNLSEIARQNLEQSAHFQQNRQAQQ